MKNAAYLLIVISFFSLSVLFPPLCFVDATHGVIPNSVKDNIRNVLTKEEYNIITSEEDNDDIPIKVKFKLVEMFQNSKIKIAQKVNKGKL